MQTLRHIMKEQHIGVVALAKKSEISPQTLTRARRGHPIRPITLRRIARALGVRPEDIAGIIVI